MSEAIDSKKISCRRIVAGIAPLGVYGFAAEVHAAETRPLAERLAEYAAALRYEDLDAGTIEASSCTSSTRSGRIDSLCIDSPFFAKKVFCYEASFT